MSVFRNIQIERENENYDKCIIINVHLFNFNHLHIEKIVIVEDFKIINILMMIIIIKHTMQ